MNLIEEIKKIAKEAGEKILDIYENEDFSKTIDFKSDDSPLTVADKASHVIIEKGLLALPIQYPILSEEGAHQTYDERKYWTSFWCVDPLDGTKEFINRNGEFTVNIALIENGVPVLGVIYSPVLDKMFYGSTQDGAFVETENGVEKIAVNNKKENLIAVRSKSHAAPEEEELLAKYPVSDATSMGSSLKFCLVAEGKADIYYRHGPTMEWDTAAGQAIVQAAGGVVLNAEGKVFTYNKENLRNGSFLCKGF